MCNVGHPLFSRQPSQDNLSIDSLWSPSLNSLNSQHHPAIYWAKSKLWEHSSLQDICDFHHGQPFWYKHRCLEEKNVPSALILSSRWQDSAESLGREHTSCLWLIPSCVTLATGDKYSEFELYLLCQRAAVPLSTLAWVDANERKSQNKEDFLPVSSENASNFKITFEL